MLVQDLGRDLRIGLGILAKERALSAGAVTALALGIGGVATIFSVVNGVLLRGFSFPNANRLVSVDFATTPACRTRRACACGLGPLPGQSPGILIHDHLGTFDTPHRRRASIAYITRRVTIGSTLAERQHLSPVKFGTTPHSHRCFA